MTQKETNQTALSVVEHLEALESLKIILDVLK